MDLSHLLQLIQLEESEIDMALLERVFIHRSYINEHRKKGVKHNERLEFLGDAVLELIITEYLFRNYENPEGELTNWRSALVKGATLAIVARDLKLGQYLKLSNGEEKSGGREKDYLLANTVEALIGFIYLASGYSKAQIFVHRFIVIKLPEILSKKLYIDSKSYFQEQAQEKLSITPNYKLLKEEGPDHQKIFTMGVYLNKELIASGKGSNKQNAEQQAAREALIAKKWILTEDLSRKKEN